MQALDRNRPAKRRVSRLLLVTALLLLAILSVAAGPHQEGGCPQGEEPTGCAQISLSPATLTADFFIGDQRVASGVNPAYVPVPAQTSVVVDVRNVRDSGEGFGDAYVYGDASSRVWVSAGQTSRYTAYPRKTFIKGFLQLTCDIRSVKEGDNVACRPSIDGKGYPDLPPGEKATYNLEPGQHAVRVEVKGNNANLWDPFVEQTTSIVVGSTRYLRATFNKLGLLTIVLSEEGIVGDLYVDDVLVAKQAATAQQWVVPYTSHRVEVRNISDPTSSGEYGWQDAASSAYLSPGQERTTTLYPRKGFIKGFLRVRCVIDYVPPGREAYCRVRVDNDSLDPAIYPGETVDFALFPGQHEVIVFVGPRGQWMSTPFEYTVNISPGSYANVYGNFGYEGPR